MSQHTGERLAPLDRARPSSNVSLSFPQKKKKTDNCCTYTLTHRTTLDRIPGLPFHQHAVTHEQPGKRTPALKIEALHTKIEMMNSHKGLVSSHKNEGENSFIEKLNICGHISVNETRSGRL